MHWYVVQTKPRQEQRALLNLERQGFPCYLPTRAKKKLKNKISSVEYEPLFTNYLFIQLDLSTTAKSWTPVKSTLGVSRLVGFGTQPLSVDPQLIEIIQSYETDLSNQNPEPLFSTGQKVTVTDGPFKGIEAVFQLEDGDARSIVLIDILGKQTRLQVATSSLCK